MTGTRSRLIEDLGFVVAVLIGGLYAGVEALVAGGILKTDCLERAFPWGVTMVIAALALPKTLGRSTAGRVWEIIAGLFGGKRSGTTPPED